MPPAGYPGGGGRGPIVVPPPPALLLSVSANGRYLVDGGGTPFRIQGEGLWQVALKLTSSEVDVLLDDRKAKGFNAIEFSVIEYNAGSVNNVNGDGPFSTPGDFTTPNEAYFANVDSIVDKAAARGMLVELFYAYLGYGGGSQGWWSTVGANTLSACYGFGVYLGNRYRNKPNIIWMAMGDYTPPNDAQGAKSHAILEGIRSVDKRHLCGAETGPPDGIPADVAGYTASVDPAAGDINLHSFYTCGASFDGLTYVTADTAWSHAVTLPAWGCETYYETATFIGTLDGTPKGLRASHFWSVFGGGIAGCNYGHQSLYTFPSGWQSLLNSQGANERSHAFRFFARVPWWRMRPSGTASGYFGRTIVVSGAGSGASRIVSCGADNGSCMLIYVPPTGTGTTTFSVDFRSMASASRCRWWNPTTDVYTDLSGGAYAYANSLSAQSFTTPGNNGDGTNDWVLVVESL